MGFYLDDSDKLSRIENLHHIANTGDFKGQSLTNYVNVFAISIPNKLYSWLKNTTSATLQKQILNWHAAYYTFNSFQDFAKQELTPLALPEVKSIIEKYYPMNYKEKFFLDDIKDIGEYETKRSEALEFYYNISERYVGSLPPEFLRNPYQDPYYNKVKYVSWGLLPNCNFSIEVSYFTKYDWIIIVERSKEKLKEFHSWSLKNNLIPKEDTAKGYVYLLRNEFTRRCKIGWTTKEDINIRKSAIQTGSDEKIECLGNFPASSKKTEAALHNYFRLKKYRDGGEWFELSDEDIKNILDPDWRNENNIF